MFVRIFCFLVGHEWQDMGSYTHYPIIEKPQPWEQCWLCGKRRKKFPLVEDW
jgi:hypothetical protein